jgi:hypothetical protein
MADPRVDPGDEGPPVREKRSVGRRIAGAVLTFGVVIAIFVFLVPTMTGASSLGDSLALITWTDVAVVTALGFVNLASN